MGKRALKVLAVCLAFALIGAVAFAGAQKEKAAPAGGKQLTIGFDAMNVAFTWMKFAHDAMVKKAGELGIKFIVYDSENDVAKQTANMEDLVALGVDGIVVNPIDVSSLVPAINKAAKTGIPVATFDRAAVGADYTFYVGCDDVAGGRMIADFVAKKLGGKGKIILITGSPGSSPQLDRSKGFKEQLAAKYPGLTIAFEQTGEFFREKGMQVMEDAITAVPDFNAVVCQNDDMMMGAIQALKSAGIPRSKYVLVGYDGVPDGLRAVRDGLADCTVQYPIGQAPEVLERLVRYLRGEKPAQKDYEMPPWIITKDNLKTGDFYSLIAND
jgi:ABC-type sugar transport system substrate-binding protein